MVETELSVLTRQCLDRRIPDQDTLMGTGGHCRFTGGPRSSQWKIQLASRPFGRLRVPLKHQPTAAPSRRIGR